MNNSMVHFKKSTIPIWSEHKKINVSSSIKRVKRVQERGEIIYCSVEDGFYWWERGMERGEILKDRW